MEAEDSDARPAPLVESTRDAARCSRTLASGKRCSRRAAPDSAACWQHCDGYAEKDALECSICMERVCRACALDCSHVFHRRCIRRWLLRGTDSCPLCRRGLSTYEMYILGVKRKQEYLLDTELTTILTVIDMLFDGLV